MLDLDVRELFDVRQVFQLRSRDVPGLLREVLGLPLQIILELPVDFIAEGLTSGLFDPHPSETVEDPLALASCECFDLTW